MNNSQIFFDKEAFLMCQPYNLSFENPNNIWMKELEGIDDKVNLDKAMLQWNNLYNFIAADNVVHLIPAANGLQDQVYTANLGCVLPHLKTPTVVISNYKSEPRVKEADVGLKYFEMMGYEVHQAPKYFEGEADLKFIKDNIYLGATGIRTSIESLNWMSEKFNMKIVPIQMYDEYLYHLDCLVFPLIEDTVLVPTELVDEHTLDEIEKFANIIDVPENLAYAGLTNSVRAGKTILCASNLEELSINDEYYQDEKAKVEFLVKTCSRFCLEPAFFDLSEFYKSGAMLSCCIMHLNYK